MKKVILVYIGVMISFVNLTGQASLGLKIGYSNFSKVQSCKFLTDDENCLNHIKTQGVNIGIASIYPINKKWGILSELFYTTKGSKPSVEKSRNIENHIVLPILMSYNLNSKLRVYFGLETSYLFSLYHASKFSFFKRDIDVIDFKNRFDLGFNTGISIQVFKRWFVDLRFNEGFLSLAPNSNVRNRGFYLSLHRYFGSRDLN